MTACLALLLAGCVSPPTRTEERIPTRAPEPTAPERPQAPEPYARPEGAMWERPIWDWVEDGSFWRCKDGCAWALGREEFEKRRKAAGW